MIAKLLGDALIIDVNKNCSSREIEQSSNDEHHLKKIRLSDGFDQPNLSFDEKNSEEGDVTAPGVCATYSYMSPGRGLIKTKILTYL